MNIVRKSRKRSLLVEKCVEVKASSVATPSLRLLSPSDDDLSISSDPLYILYTSGSTGTPKGVVRTNGGHAVASRAAIQYTFGLSREDTIFCASDIGWVVGHSYIIYGPLLIGMSSVIFEGKRESSLQRLQKQESAYHVAVKNFSSLC